MNKGVLLFAQNNSKIDYTKQAIFCAKRIKQYMNLPVALATDNREYAESLVSSEINSIIDIEPPRYSQNKHFYNGVYSSKTLPWYNHSRSLCYNITPFEETIVIDTDFIISNNQLNYAFEIDKDLLLYKNICDVGYNRDLTEFKFITDTSIPMCWATVFYFKKNYKSKLFFDLILHIQQEWNFYRLQYQIVNKNFRNDFAFSIAAHILSGYNMNNFVGTMPGKFWFTSDRDIPLSIVNSEIKFLIDQNNSAKYIPVKMRNSNVHIMNKFALQEIIENV